jgi:hypothetical protein
MKSWQIVRLVAGFMVLLSLLLGAPASPQYLSQYWLLLAVFVGANLLQSSLTGWCLLESLLRRVGVRPGC